MIVVISLRMNKNRVKSMCYYQIRYNFKVSKNRSPGIQI